MSDIVTSRIFVDGEKGITAAKLNDIVASSVIQPAFYTGKPTASTADPPDVMLILKAGAYTQVPVSTLAGSLSNAAIWSVRLRSFNAVGNPNFECDQRNVGASTLAGAFAVDRWNSAKTGATLAASTQQVASVVNVPGTSFAITRNVFRVTLTTQQAALAAGDRLIFFQTVEGSVLRELINDVHSISILCRSSVAGLNFGVSLRDGLSAYSLTSLCAIPAANTWTLITLPNIPIWTASGSFPVTPGIAGYSLMITLAAGATFISPANGTWQTGNFYGAAGQSNFANNAVNSTFDIAFVQHEPGAVCTTLMDKPFSQNYDECLRYYCKSSPYVTAPVNGSTKVIGNIINSNATVRGTMRFPKPMAKTPTLRTCGTTVTLNQVFLEASSANVNVNAYSPDDSGLVSLQLSSAAPAAPSNSVSTLAGWDADTGW